jgi:hypothetical protein
MTANDTICNAIHDRITLRFSYKGKTRHVEPHALGYDADGDLTLCVFQLSGGSGRDFRDFHVRNLAALTTGPEGFAGARPGYRRDSDKLSRVICQL